MSTTSSSQEAFRERFHQVYNELIQSGFSEVESAARALLVAGGREVDLRHGARQSEADLAPTPLGDSLNITNPEPPVFIVADEDDADDDNRSPFEQSSVASNGGETASCCSSFFDEIQDSSDRNDYEEVNVELITAQRAQELVQIGRACDNNFQELIRFLGRTMSSPECVFSSFVHVGDITQREHSRCNRHKTVGDDDVSLEETIMRGRALHTTSEDEEKSPTKQGEERRAVTSTLDLGKGKMARGHGVVANIHDAAVLAAETLDCFASTVANQKATNCKCPDRSAPSVNVAAVAHLWQALREVHLESLSRCVLTALESLAQTLLLRSLDRSRATGKRDGVDRVSNQTSICALLLVLEHPEVQDPDFDRVLSDLFKLVVSFVPERIDELRSLMADLGEEHFSKYLDAVHQFIALRLYTGGDSTSVLTAVHFLHVLYTANQQSRKVDDKAFFSEAINSELFSRRHVLVDDYGRWRQDHGKTNPCKYRSLISFREVLDPASKAAVLSVDSQIQMRGTIEGEFQEALLSGGYSGGEVSVMPYLLLRVRRGHIVEDSLHALVMLPDDDLKKPLRVQFVGEEGVDEGGVRKEYFQVMLRELLDPKYSMLKYDEESRRLWFNNDSLEAREEFELVGILLGIAIYNSIILDVRFPAVVYRLLMGEKPDLQDLKEAQPSLGRGLQQLLDFEGDVEAVFERSFQISYEVFGAVKTFDLKENGGAVTVTKENRQEYVDLYAQWVLVESVKGQYEPFERGFHKVVGGRALGLFRPEELELLVCGNPQLDFRALEDNSTYEDGYREDTPVIRNFWEVLHEFEEDSKRKFLKFATGSDRAPIQGLGSNALSLVISKHGDDSDRLPTAHTCFNHLLLPPYSTKEKLANRLKIAIEQSEGFGLR